MGPVVSALTHCWRSRPAARQALEAFAARAAGLQRAAAAQFASELMSSPSMGRQGGSASGGGEAATAEAAAGGAAAVTAAAARVEGGGGGGGGGPSALHLLPASKAERRVAAALLRGAGLAP
jgi:hypothetical protein